MASDIWLSTIPDMVREETGVTRGEGDGISVGNSNPEHSVEFSRLG